MLTLKMAQERGGLIKSYEEKISGHIGKKQWERALDSAKNMAAELFTMSEYIFKIGAHIDDVDLDECDTFFCGFLKHHGLAGVQEDRSAAYELFCDAFKESPLALYWKATSDLDQAMEPDFHSYGNICVKAARLGCKEACAAAGELLVTGDVLEKDMEQGSLFLSFAAAMGHEKSQRMLEEVEEHPLPAN